TGLQIQAFKVSTSREIDAAFASFGRERPDAVFADVSSLFVDRRVQLALQAMLHRLPSAFHVRELAEAGGLMSYRTSLRDSVKQAGAYGRPVVKGAQPRHLSVWTSSQLNVVMHLQYGGVAV